MILVLDNYDSFVYNLARYIRQLTSEPVEVIRNDLLPPRFCQENDVKAIVISPGPCGPTEANLALDLVAEQQARIPMLGVCLGHQIIAQAFGCQVVRSDDPRHGKSSQIVHDGSQLFAGVPCPFQVGRYHSLIVDRDTLDDAFRVSAWTVDNTIMAIEHWELPLFGVQFHPESVLTEHGYRLLHNFLSVVGIESQLRTETGCV